MDNARLDLGGWKMSLIGGKPWVSEPLLLNHTPRLRKLCRWSKDRNLYRGHLGRFGAREPSARWDLQGVTRGKRVKKVDLSLGFSGA